MCLNTPHFSWTLFRFWSTVQINIVQFFSRQAKPDDAIHIEIAYLDRVGSIECFGRILFKKIFRSKKYENLYWRWSWFLVTCIFYSVSCQSTHKNIRTIDWSLYNYDFFTRNAIWNFRCMLAQVQTRGKFFIKNFLMINWLCSELFRKNRSPAVVFKDVGLCNSYLLGINRHPAAAAAALLLF